MVDVTIIGPSPSGETLDTWKIEWSAQIGMNFSPWGVWPLSATTQVDGASGAQVTAVVTPSINMYNLQNPDKPVTFDVS